MRSELVEPGDTPRPCDTMNGNATLISRAVLRRVGNIDYVRRGARLVLERTPRRPRRAAP
jgi:hypothetical protein